MKSTAKILFLFILLGSIASGCKKLLDVEFDATFKAEMPVVVAASALKDGLAEFTFDVSDSIDPTTNSNYDKYFEKIKKITVTSIIATIKNPSKPVTLLNMTCEVWEEGSTTKTTWTFPSTVVVDGTKFTFTDEGRFDKIENMFFSGKTIHTRCFGKTDVSGVTFTIVTEYGTKFVANPLN
jgi:hypothetical protein